MYIRGIILAAGKSSRMGENKLQLKIQDIPMIDIVIQNAKKSKLDELIVVYGKYDLITDITKVFNCNYEKGMSTSVKCGLEGFNGDGVMILLGDMPFIETKIIDELYTAFTNSSKNIVVPMYRGMKGNPVIIGRKYFHELINNTGDKGAREIINNHQDDVERLEIESDKIFVDIDNTEVYNNMLKKALV